MAMKYRQRGYRDSDRDSSRDGERPSRPPLKQLTPEERAQQRSLRHAVQREATEVVRCHNCGKGISGFGAIGADTTCPYCSVPLHCCRACRHFDTASRFECRAEIPERIVDKGKANACAQFAARVVLDATGKRTTPASQPSNDPKALFDSLFKR